MQYDNQKSKVLYYISNISDVPSLSSLGEMSFFEQFYEKSIVIFYVN
jgi:hypothetical protein